MTPIKKAAGSLVLFAAATLLAAQAFAQTPSVQPPAVTSPAAQAPVTPAPAAQAPAAPAAQAPAAQAPDVTASPSGVQATTSPAKNPALPHNLSPWGMFMGADIVVKAVLIGRAFDSILTWSSGVAKLL